MRTRTITAGLTAAAALLALTACSSTEEAKPVDKPKASAAPSAPSQADLDKAREAAGLPPKPDAATAKAFVDALNAIDPDIVHGKDEKAVSRGSDTCGLIKRYPGDQAKQIEQTNKRWISANHPDGHGLATAEKILHATHEHLCPDF
jgi:ABC-type enterochelin transport system substrate-binding protein